ncbi:MAG: HNH endonuclease signature motif containing protein [Pseudonocardiaceae bacterium]
MTDGSYTGLDDAAIIELLTTTGPDRGDSSGEVNRDDDGEPDGHDPDIPEPDDNGPDDNGPGGGAQADEHGSRVPGAPSARSSWGAGVELRVQLSTLLGRDQYPAELAGWGPAHAELARDLAPTLGGAQWRFAITNEHGQLTHSGITRARPTGTPTRAAACRAIVELQIPATMLRALATDPSTAGSWAGVVADLTAQLDHHLPDHSQDCGDAARRVPGAVLRRFLEIRDRFCTMIGCRAPAHGTDQDHTLDHALGGPTIGPNLGGACRHDHRLKGEGGWQLHQPEPGVFCWRRVGV